MTRCTCMIRSGPHGYVEVAIEDPQCPARRIHARGRGEVPVSDEVLDLEFAYVSWSDSCQDIYNHVYECRRAAYHEGDHAAGFGEERVRW